MSKSSLKFGITFTAIIMAIVGSLLIIYSSLAKTTVTQNPGTECEFTVTVEVAFAFLDQGG